ncbi:ATP-binding protein [uncultured Odoribacter sp.]|uniref:sensor histidine kinase n=1 Tax=uncultured Odoribacter sp. TaxID=876416 RepID=UPI00261F236A|nr:ATP-binding protein [uncultured Odoribacter sp.]
MDYFDDRQIERLMGKARIGWWEADFVKQQYHCSPFISRLLNLGPDGVIRFEDFRELICQDYRLRTVNEFSFGKTQNVYDQVYPINTTEGIQWVRVKLCSKETDAEGNLKTYGFMECLDSPENESPVESTMQRVNNLFSQQNSISHSLFSIFQTEDIGSVIQKILGDILQQFPKGRTYIVEYNAENQTSICRYQVSNDIFSFEISHIIDIPVRNDSWWTRQLIDQAMPIILANLNELPPEAENIKKYLQEQGVHSTLAVPMFSRDGVWGYAGIDIADKNHIWKNEDYQWFSSLVNIISICMQFRKAEEQALAEKQYLADLYKHMPIGYTRLGLVYNEQQEIVDYVLKDVNEACLEIYNIGADIVGKRGSSLKSEIQFELQIFKNVVKSKQPLERNFYLEKQDKYCHCVMYSPYEGEIVTLFSDMTDTFKAHEALDRSERILRNIYRNLPAGIELYNEKGNLIDINDKEFEIFGIKKKEDVLGINIFDNPIMPEEMKEKMRKREDASFTLDYDFSNLKGYYPSDKTGKINLLTKITALYDSQNNFTNYLLIHIDRTEATVAYNQIREFKDFFTLVGDYAKVGYAHYNALSRDGYALDSWYRNVGEAEGTPLPQVIGVYTPFHPEDREVMIDFLEKVIRGEASSLRRDLRIFRKNGQQTWTRTNVLVRDYRPQEGVIEMLSINYDITELKEIEAKLIAAKEKAEESDRLKSAFLANMSHEIRTPLNAIVGFSTLMAETDNKNEQQQYLEIVEKNNELLLQLISDILDLSKIEAGTFEINMEEVDVNQLCEDIIQILKYKTPPGVELLFSEHLPEYCIRSDKKRIQQVLTNFINNAQKFTTHGTIALGYRICGQEIEFSVTDTGIGIQPEKQAEIFQRFVKLNNFVHGTGLGLSICKSIIEQIHGRIGVQSEPGKGSRFWFTLPLV